MCSLSFYHDLCPHLVQVAIIMLLGVSTRGVVVYTLSLIADDLLVYVSYLVFHFLPYARRNGETSVVNTSVSSPQGRPSRDPLGSNQNASGEGQTRLSVWMSFVLLVVATAVSVPAVCNPCSPLTIDSFLHRSLVPQESSWSVPLTD